jgi:hypothetical protein
MTPQGIPGLPTGNQDRLQVKIASKHVQIPLFGDDEDSVGPNEQMIRDEFDRHRREVRQDLVKLRGDSPHMIDDDDGDTHVDRQIP